MAELIHGAPSAESVKKNMKMKTKVIWADNIIVGDYSGDVTGIAMIDSKGDTEFEVCFEKPSWDIDTEEECIHSYYAYVSVIELAVAEGGQLKVTARCHWPKDECTIFIPPKVISSALNWFMPDSV